MNGRLADGRNNGDAGALPEERRKILRAVALAYRRVMRAPAEPAATRAEEARLAQKRQSPTWDKLAVSGEVNRMIAAAINADPRWF
jgi:hypothetical protein